MPISAVQTAILHRFGKMLGGDALGPVEIRDRASDLQHAVVGAGAEAHAADGHLEGSLARIV